MCLTGSDAGLGQALAVLPGGLLQISNLTYATRGGYVLQGDLVVPPLDAGTPGILVVIHGGGWEDCNRRRTAGDVVSYAQSMAAIYKVATFSIEYRLRQEGGAYPENLKDVRCALQWISSHASMYGLDGTRLAVAGESAGAHLALMSAQTYGRADLDPQCGTSVKPKLVLEYSSPTDLQALGTIAPALNATVNAYAGPCTGAPAACVPNAPACSRCEDASPLAHACSSPPTTYALIHAAPGFDQLVPTAQAQSLHAVFLDGGVDSHLLIPNAAELTDAGCKMTQAEQAHGWNKQCLQRATGLAVAPLIDAAIGRR